MKKLIASLAIAGAATFASYATETWFVNAVNSTLTSSDGTWSQVSGWSWNATAGAIDYKNMDAELTFKVTEAQAMPADVAIVKTEVKFTAMAKEDFDDMNPSVWAGAKGGLTIIEYPEETYSFWGIVGGEWTELAPAADGKTAAQVLASSDPVEVGVKIWQNGGRKISYSIDGKLLGGDTGAGLVAADVGGLTIDTISYRGVCQLKTLAGERDDELWNLTFQTVAEAIDVLIKVGNKQEFTVKGNVGQCAITGTTEKVTVKYMAPPADGGYYFFKNGAKGVKTGYEEDEITVEGSGEIVSADQYSGAGFTYAEAAAKVLDETENAGYYATVAGAIGKGSAIEVQKDVAENLTLGKAVTLSALNNDVVIGGSFAQADNSSAGPLTILSGKYTSDFTGIYPKLCLKGGSFTGLPAVWQPYCDAEGHFFAESNEDQDFTTKVVVGKAAPKQEGLPEGLYVNDDVENAAAAKGMEVGAYLVLKADNGLKNYENLALGIDSSSTETPKVAVDEIENNQVVLVPANFAPVPSTGLEVTYKVGNGSEVLVPTIEVPAAGQVERQTVKVLVDGQETIATTEIAANTIAPATDKRTMVSVSWSGNDGITLKDLFMASTLTVNDKVEIYEQSSDAYLVFYWNGTSWVSSPVATVMAGQKKAFLGAAANGDDVELARGEAVWFTPAEGKTGNIVQAGVVDGSACTVAVSKDKWTFAACPLTKSGGIVLGTDTSFAALPETTQVQIGDIIYTKTASGWQYEGVDMEHPITRRGQKTYPTVTKTAGEDVVIAPGEIFWVNGVDNGSISL